MNEKDNTMTHEANWLADFEPIEPIERFAPEQMVECDACRRNNPPTRMNCFYCGAALTISEKNQNLVRPVLRKLENWEKGFNVICLPSAANVANPDLQELAAFLRLSQDELAKIFAATAPLPLARVGSGAEAALIQDRLEKNDVASEIVCDEQLEIEKLPARVRGVEFGEQQLALRLSGNELPFFLNAADIKLFVAGVIFEHRRESSERRTRGENLAANDAREYSADEKILDFFTAHAPQGFRIASNSFDFSCLGAQKRLLAAENFEALLDMFCRHSPAAVFDRNYKTVRSALGAVWSVDEKKESAGWHHAGIGKINLDTIVTVNNQNQFTKYSRTLFLTLNP